MYPPVGIGQVRISTSHDITLADQLHIPAGTCIWVPHHAMQNATFNWDDPDKFLPGEQPFLLESSEKLAPWVFQWLLDNLQYKGAPLQVPMTTRGK